MHVNKYISVGLAVSIPEPLKLKLWKLVIPAAMVAGIIATANDDVMLNVTAHSANKLV